jgi:hypothetical protein
MYSHISTGWKGKQWGGDHDAIEECLRLYGAAQMSNGFIPWLSCALVPFTAENNTAYWVDQVWSHYTWTGDARFLRDLFPAVRKAVQWVRATNDPDGDGLFRDFYEYWNCDSNGKGPKSVVPTAMAWAMMDRAASIAGVLGDADAASEYRALADKTREAALRELWREDKGRLGCIGADGIWRGHPQTWEEYLPILCGLLDESQGRRAMRWLASHYGFHPSPDVSLLACSDWYPTRWSVQWVPTGDTCLAALAGMRCGDADIWWPYLRTVVDSAFRSDCPGINMGISNTGAGGGDREDVDSVDPHVHGAVRGLFGIEPAIHEGRIDIHPAFPSDWPEASIRTPDIAYEWRREGSEAVLAIRTPKPLVKAVRVAGAQREVTTASEDYSVVRVPLPDPAPPLEPPEEPTILRDQVASAPPAAAPPSADELARAVLFDLRGAYNVTAEEFTSQGFVYDCQDGPAPIGGWWGNPPLVRKAAPRGVATRGGVPFLTSGRDADDAPAAKNLLALTSWAPNPWPAEATIPVGLRCERAWVLLQSYVHPMKNYIPNGEIVLRYADGPEEIVSLIPPYNLDAYFQHFSLSGDPASLGSLRIPAGWGFVPAGLCEAHADSLALPCDPARLLRSITVRATCSEGAIGVVGLTVVPASATRE